MPPLIVTGMHRSATSLVASLLHESGVPMGARLLQPGRGNLRGYFEDEDFVEFHDRALRNRGLSIYVSEPFRFDPTPEEMEAARRLIDGRKTLPNWGWKDPRTTLFLDFWVTMLPDATFLFLYRHPIETLSSLLRRLEPMADWVEALEAWGIYNDQLIAFWQEHRPQSLLCHGYAAVDHPEALSRVLLEKLGPGLVIEAKTRETVYRADELKRLPLSPGLTGAFSRLYPRLQGLYDRMQAMADVPARAGPPDDAPLTELRPFFELVASLPPGSEARHARAGLHVLMTCLEAEAVDAASREARRVLDELRTRSAWLEEQRGFFLDENQRLKQSFADQSAWAEGLQQERIRLLALQEEQRAFFLDENQRLKQALAEQGEWAEELRQERVRLLALQEEWQAERASLLARLEELRQANADLSQRAADLRRKAQEAELALGQLRSSTRWRIMGPLWRLAGVLAPPNSRRAALIGSSLRKLSGRRP